MCTLQDPTRTECWEDMPFLVHKVSTYPPQRLTLPFPLAEQPDTEMHPLRYCMAHTMPASVSPQTSQPSPPCSSTLCILLPPLSLVSLCVPCTNICIFSLLPLQALVLSKGTQQLVPRKALQSLRPKWHPPCKLMRVISGHLGWVRCITVDPSNEWFATGSGDRTIKVGS